MHGAPRCALRTRGYCQQHDYVAEDVRNGKSRLCTAMAALKLLALVACNAFPNTVHRDSVGDIVAEREAMTLAPQVANNSSRSLSPNRGVSRSRNRSNPARWESLEDAQGPDAHIGIGRKMESCGALEKLRRTPHMCCDSERSRTGGLPCGLGRSVAIKMVPCWTGVGSSRQVAFRRQERIPPRWECTCLTRIVLSCA